ncbi:hypothetical protein O181_039302 [Austropuccinia psidii MF-1]|uniref:Integrase catalytic domain-containing protein n=1 Tax=Austropuccinia psidii MF-1 TaxID=1389203 RepID=A0A9Q3HCS9_9BASI|nr:hypothetical protein [Austropuccinia psidii MF-1]
MDWVTDLPPGGERSYNACLVLVKRYSKNKMFLPCHKDDTAMDRAIMLFGTNLSFSTAYHPKADGLAERIIQNLEDIIGGFCAHGPKFKDYNGFTHYWCTLIPALELAYETSIHSSTGKAPAMLEKGLNPRLPYDTLKNCLVDITPTASSFKMMLDKARHHENRCPRKLKDSFAGPLMIKALHGTNAVQLELTGELMNKHPNFPVSLIKTYSSSDNELFPLRNKLTLEIPPLEEGEERKMVKVLKERRTRNKKEREYLLRYGNPTQEDEWLLEKDITHSNILPRRLINERKPIE